MALHTKLWYFERFGLINVLTEPQRRQFVGLTRMLEVKRGNPIYLPGDRSDQMFLLKAGVIKISSVAPGEGERILTLLYPGDVFGELAVVDDVPRDHLAVVHENAVICAMSRETLLKMIHAVPELGFQITN